jgi:GT2 family glycosyltransferase
MKIGVSISNYKNDQSVLMLVDKILREKWPIFEMIIVDSLGSTSIPEAISKNSWNNVHYFNFETNLGSAGNLHHRMRIASERGWSFALALNHDALLSRDTLNALIKHIHIDKIGALYPLKFFPTKNEYDISGTREVGPWRALGLKKPPENNQLIEAIWSSSNGALYSTLPFKEGLYPRPELWMGWEDYLYGIELQSKNYKQYLVPDALTEDNYEFETRSIAGSKMMVSNKPTWYQYYRIRNLCLIAFHYQINLFRIFNALIRTDLECLAIFLGWEKHNKILAFKLLLIGFWHGLIGRSGKWKLP